MFHGCGAHARSRCVHILLLLQYKQKCSTYVLVRAGVGEMNRHETDVAGRLIEAVNFAAIKHRDQRRKDEYRTPYINHPIGVAYSIWKEGGVTDISVLQVCYYYIRSHTHCFLSHTHCSCHTHIPDRPQHCTIQWKIRRQLLKNLN